MKCPRKVKRFFWSKGIVCGGKLVKLNDYYVCNKCCKDNIPFEMISKIAQEERGIFATKPTGKCIELTHPEFSGYYEFEEIGISDMEKKIHLIWYWR